MFKKKEIPFIAFGADEIDNNPELESIVTCHICGKKHEVEYGDIINEDGTKEKSEMLAFIKCPKTGETYMVGINGKNIMGKLSK
jgi:hypothetical protein